MTTDNRTAVPRPVFGPADRNLPKPRLAPRAVAVPQAALDIRRIIARSFSLMGRNGVTFLALVAAAAVPERLLYHLLGASDGALLLGLVLQALACIPLYAAVFHGALNDLRGTPVRFGACLAAAMRMRAPAAGAIAMTVTAVWLLLVLPLIGAATRWALIAPVAIAEGGDLRQVLARSTALTAPYISGVRLLILLLAGFSVSRALAMMPLWGMPFEALLAFIIANWLFLLLLTAFTAAAGAVLYEEIGHAAKPETP